ncbi:hypothetical protein MAR_012513 [Mya arenaria]|uniref:Uncharacterized protein n=1 Tax=Mya arenaria TaxID=6604 RepID=A0ABY7G0Q4_MYAAR|nr:hypothetical protein MAR_012513 [Mya arenaria]
MRGEMSIIVNVCLVMFVVSLIVGCNQRIPSIASGIRKTPIYKVIQNKGRSKGIPMNTSSQHTVTSSLSSITQYGLRILLIVYNRAQSMLPNFDGDNIKLEVWIDRSKTGDVDSLTVETAEGFVFKHGHYEVLKHSQHVGIYREWLTTWKLIANSFEIAVILEDDLTVSPHFYKYLKLVHNKYDSIPEINGFALQGMSIKHGIGYSSQTLEGPEGCLVFLYPVLGTWGFSPKRDNWIHFLEWFSKVNQDKTFQPYIPDNVMTEWFKTFQSQGKAGHKGLAANWMEAGLHFAKSANKPTNDLLTEWESDYENLPDQPKHLDLKGGVQD